MDVNTLHFASYNMHGFNNGYPMLLQLLNQCDIVLIQEHWLQSNGLHKLGLINNDFAYLAVSSMDEKLSKGILCGRPFGGTGILWRKSLCINVKLIRKSGDGRVITVSLADKFMVTCMYLPCHSSSVDYAIELTNICADLESVIEAYPQYVHLVAGDLNFECNTGNIGYDIFSSMAKDCRLKCVDNYDDKCGYTYFHDALEHYSWIDHVFISSSATDTLQDFCILDSGCNNSAHLPLTWSVLCNDHITGLNSSKNYRAQKRMYKQRWDKANLMLFYAITGTHLQSIDVPKHLLHDNINYERDIEKYYDDIVSVLLEASKLSVPSIPCQALKNFWNDDLDYLKQQSIDIHNLWKEIGKPHHGLINKARIHAKSEYKRAVRDAAVDFEKSHIDEVTEYFAHKDMNNFWKCWSTKYNKHINADNVSINGCQKHRI